MIISDTKRFVFIHIPKCAGTAVRRIFSEWDETEGAFSVSRIAHPVLGVVDSAHLPLFVLREHFPEAFHKVEAYSAFALVRDPFERFRSAFSQHVNMHGKKRLETMSQMEVRRKLEEVITFLSDSRDSGAALPIHYVHFQRQADFVYVQGRRVVENLFPVARVPDFLRAVSDQTGWDVTKATASLGGKANECRVYRNAMYQVAGEWLRSGVRAVGSGDRFLRLRAMGRKALMVPRDKRLGLVLGSCAVRDFVEDYYQADVALYRVAEQE